MEYEHYQSKIENWATSLMELEEQTHANTIEPASFPESNSALISLGLPTYYRSKAFSSTVGINQLINAADPLLTLATKLSSVTQLPEPVSLHQHICHELNAFENKTQTLKYRQPMILAAKYVLCALLDERIETTLWPTMIWQKYSLIKTFYKENTQDDKFFLILERGMQDPVSHLELLELIYICLRLGYEGKYQKIDRGHLELGKLTDHLYDTIMQHHEEGSRSLHITLEMPINLTHKQYYAHLLPPTWLIGSLMTMCLLLFFGVFYAKLIAAASPITEFLQTLKDIPVGGQSITATVSKGIG